MDREGLGYDQQEKSAPISLVVSCRVYVMSQVMICWKAPVQESDNKKIDPTEV
jgi:hypothetical protein